MSLSENGNIVMPVSPMVGSGDGLNGGEGWWIILFLFALMGGNGWGNGFGGGNNGMALWPYFTSQNTDANVQRGFDTAALTSQLSGIQTSLTNGFASQEVAACNRDLNSIKATYDSEIASMNQRFNDTVAIQSSISDVASGLQNCCCENRANIADLKYTVATEACADRQAINDALKDVLTQQTANTQRILDQMCQDKIDAKNERIAQLETQLNMANLVASQGAQTSAILADNSRQTSILEDYLNPVPRPAYIVANPNGCNCGTNYACGSF